VSATLRHDTDVPILAAHPMTQCGGGVNLWESARYNRAGEFLSRARTRFNQESGHDDPA
jgi:hypothetical protein